MADTYAVYVKFREVRQDLMAAVYCDRMAWQRLRRMQRDLPWWRAPLFLPLHARHVCRQTHFQWLRLQLQLMSLTLPKRLRRMP
jgi:hypothetical protein